jgi:putative flippase GtrA
MSLAEPKLDQATIRRPTTSSASSDWVDRLTAVPRLVRFLGVGALGLFTDLGIFSIITRHGFDPLLVRPLSLSCATLVTWRLNRVLTFDRSGRRPGREAVRYAIVTVAAQGTSYAVFATLMLTVLDGLSPAALLIGSAAGAIVSYNGNRLFAFAPLRRIGGLVPKRACL